jgi:hypothetical protein
MCGLIISRHYFDELELETIRTKDPEDLGKLLSLNWCFMGEAP